MWGEQQLSTGGYLCGESSSSPLAAIYVRRTATLHWLLFGRGEQQLSTSVGRASGSPLTAIWAGRASGSPLAAICTGRAKRLSYGGFMCVESLATLH